MYPKSKRKRENWVLFKRVDRDSDKNKDRDRDKETYIGTLGIWELCIYLPNILCKTEE